MKARSGLTRNLSDRARRDLLLAALRSRGWLKIDKALAQSLGFKRKELEADIHLLIDDGHPLQWLSSQFVRLTPSTLPIGLDLDEGQLTTLVAALRNMRQGAHDSSMVVDASHMLHHIASQLPPAMFTRLQALGQFEVAPRPLPEDGRPTTLRHNLIVQALNDNRKLTFLYTASDGARTRRCIWPVAFTLHDSCFAGWCEARQAFRTFRIDQMAELRVSDTAIPISHAALATKWRGDLPADPASDSRAPPP